jgi:hypothetical protein
MSQLSEENAVSAPEAPAPATLLFLTMSLVLIAMNYLTYIFSAILWFMTTETSQYGLMALIHIVLFGTLAAFIPRQDKSVSKVRATRMASQGGHTLMLCYFAGQAPIAEAYRLYAKQAGASMEKVVDAAMMHASGLTVFKAILSWWSASALKDISKAIVAGASTTATTATAAASTTDADVLSTLGLDTSSYLSDGYAQYITSLTHFTHASLGIAVGTFVLSQILMIIAKSDEISSRKEGKEEKKA